MSFHAMFSVGRLRKSKIALLRYSRLRPSRDEAEAAPRGVRATALLVMSVLGLIVLPSPAVAQLRQIDYDDNPQVVEQWRRYSDSHGNDETCRRDLLRGGERSLNVLIDLICGPKEMSTPEGLRKIDDLIKQLGSGQPTERSEAAWRLKTMMPGVRPLLARHREDANEAIRTGVRGLIGDDEAARSDAAIASSLLQPATAIMERDWPMDELRHVAAANLDRLALIETVAYKWNDRPIGPLLASLRYSDDRASTPSYWRISFRKGPKTDPRSRRWRS